MIRRKMEERRVVQDRRFERLLGQASFLLRPAEDDPGDARHRGQPPNWAMVCAKGE